VKSYIDAHLSDPHLSLAKIAEKNGISLRYLHLLFRPTDMSVSEWVRMRRLQRCYEQLTSPLHRTRSVTEIAYAMGFSSSSHFSNLFRSHFGLRPTDVRGNTGGPESSRDNSLLADSNA
jgi:AraC-like DNA-binding protein